jgi:hypothetical protein
MLALDFVDNLSARFLEQNLTEPRELAGLKEALRVHVEDPDTFVISCLYIQAWGRKLITREPSSIPN